LRVNTTNPTSGKPLWRAFAAFLGPMLLSNVLQSMAGTVNNVFVGQMLGTRAVAAVSAIFPIVFFFISLVIGIGAGAAVLIGQAWGAKEKHKVKAIAGTALCLGLLLGFAVALLGNSFASHVLAWLCVPAGVLPDATRYARTMMVAMPGLMVFVLATQLLRGVGDTITPMLALLLSTIVSCALTPALIRGWAGLPMLGVTGAAAASVVSFVVALTFLAWRTRSLDHPLAPDRELVQLLRLDPRVLRLVIRIGLPAGLQMILISLAEIALLALVNNHGSTATAAYGAVNQVVNYAQFPAMSIAITASILGAQAIGAGRVERLRHIARTGLLMNLLLTGSLVALGYTFSRQLLGLFITSPAVVELAQSLLHIMLWSSVVYGFAQVLGGVMRASGAVWVPTAISILCIAAVEVPSAYVLSAQFGIHGVWMAYPIAFTATFALQAGYYLLFWRHTKIKRLV
jgi:putative MATE family efflux protein